MSKNQTNSWLRENGLKMLIFFASAIFGAGVGITAFQEQTRVNAQEIQEIKEELAEYPSQDWFELKFEEVDKSISDLEDIIN